jgi:hypothetical protein
MLLFFIPVDSRSAFTMHVYECACVCKCAPNVYCFSRPYPAHTTVAAITHHPERASGDGFLHHTASPNDFIIYINVYPVSFFRIHLIATIVNARRVYTRVYNEMWLSWTLGLRVSVRSKGNIIYGLTMAAVTAKGATLQGIHLHVYLPQNT